MNISVNLDKKKYEVILSNSYLLQSESSITICLPPEHSGEKITLSFIKNDSKTKDDMAEVISDDPDLGYNIIFYNSTSKTGEGIFPRPFDMYSKSGFTYYIMFKTLMLPGERDGNHGVTGRELSITILKGKSDD